MRCRVELLYVQHKQFQTSTRLALDALNSKCTGRAGASKRLPHSTVKSLVRSVALVEPVVVSSCRAYCSQLA